MSDFDITIIVPTFQSERVIARCLESIVSQRDVEVQVVVVDGASSDDTLKCVQGFAAPNIVVVSEQDKGIYDAINKGISLATGVMIGVLGSDDVYLPNTLSLVKKHIEDGVGIIAGLTEIDGQLRADEPYCSAALISGIPFGHNAMFASCETYKRVGLYDPSYRICGDAQWVHRAIKAGVPCLKIDEVFVRFGTAGVSSTNPEEIMNEAYRAIQENFPFLSTEEAKTLLYAYRKWIDQNEVCNIGQKYDEYPHFTKIISEAFPNKIQNQDTNKIMKIIRQARNRIKTVMHRV